MTFLIISFGAGLLTVLAPCILPLLPVVIGSAAAGRSRLSPYVIVGSLGVSIILFTYLLKVSTAFISIPPAVWTTLSGGILVLFGITLVVPTLWERMPGLAALSARSNKLMGAGYQKKSFWGDVTIGAALGPVFSTCSPTYFVILATVLPASFLLGTTYLLAYVAGLSLALLALALAGERLASRLAGVADPRGWVKRSVGVLFVILGIAIVFGYEKKVETAILESGFFDVTQIERSLLEKNEKQSPEARSEEIVGTSTPIDSLGSVTKALRLKKAPELVQPDAYLNTNGEAISLAQYRGKKVVLLDFWTYSCINCQRTFPYLTKWYEKYKDQGFVIIGVHTPEFAFEHKEENVIEALKRFGITYPVVLDNEYKTWGAFDNQFWPREYLIDIDGYIVHDHAGEGGYADTEKAIQQALAERAERLKIATPLNSSPVAVVADTSEAKSPEAYFGGARNQYLGTGAKYVDGPQTFTLPARSEPNTLYLDGSWNITREYAQSSGAVKIQFQYTARDVYLVASSKNPVSITVLRDGKPVGTFAGTDVDPVTSKATIQEERLYRLVHDTTPGTHIIEIQVQGAGFTAYTFTFG